MKKYNIISSQIGIFESPLKERPFKVAIDKKAAEISLVSLRDFSLDSYGTIDGKPFGGGVGMVLRAEPIFEALKSIHGDLESIMNTKVSPNKKIVFLDPAGTKWTQQKAREYANLDEVTFVCGRYEGIDQRAIELFASETLSVGEYVTSGGELPTLVILETILRLNESVLSKPEATELESFSEPTKKEHPQYTRPEEFLGKRVPEVLLSGDHKKIADWKSNNQK